MWRARGPNANSGAAVPLITRVIRSPGGQRLDGWEWGRGAWLARPQGPGLAGRWWSLHSPPSPSPRLGGGAHSSTAIRCGGTPKSHFHHPELRMHSRRGPGTQPRGPPGGQRGGEVASAGTDEVTALRAQLRRRAALAPAGGAGGRAAGGSAPSPRHKRSDRQGRRRDTHSETDRHACRQTHRLPQTRETATQRQAGGPTNGS